MCPSPSSSRAGPNLLPASRFITNEIDNWTSDTTTGQEPSENEMEPPHAFSNVRPQFFEFFEINQTNLRLRLRVV